MSRKLKIEIPLKINSKLSTNSIYSTKAWYTRQKQKQDILILTRASLPEKIKTFDKPVELTMSFKSKLDVSNHSYLFKMIEDSLVACKVLQDDTDKFVQKNTLLKQNFFEGVVVEIEEIKK